MRAPAPDATCHGAARADPRDEADARDLSRLGYAQELLRAMGGFSSFALSFSIISVLTGITTTYGVALAGGGPAALGLGWPLVSAGTLVVALAMAELASAFPTAGAIYHWAALARRPRLGVVHGDDEPRRAARDRRGDRPRVRADSRRDALAAGAGELAALRGDARVARGHQHLLGPHRRAAERPLRERSHRRRRVLVGLLLALGRAHPLSWLAFATGFTTRAGRPLRARVHERAHSRHVDVHGLRRLRPRQRGDARPRAAGPVGHRLGGARERRRRLRARRRADARDTRSARDRGRRPTPPSSSCAGRARRGAGAGRAGARHRGDVVLRTVVGHERFAEPLCVRAGRGLPGRAPRLVGSPRFDAARARSSRRRRCRSRSAWRARVLSATTQFLAVASLATTGLYVSYAVPIALGVVSRWKGQWRRLGPWQLGRAGVLVACGAVVWSLFVLATAALPHGGAFLGLLLGVAGVLALVYVVFFRRRFTGPPNKLSLGDET